MMKRFLSVGDVFVLEKGMRVYANVPERFVYFNHPFSMKQENTDITVGEIYRSDEVCAEINVGKLTKRIGEDIQSSTGEFLPCDFEHIRDVIERIIRRNSNLPKTFDTSIFLGKYVVESTSYSGGGTGMGGRDVYSDGHHVYARKLTVSNKFTPKGICVNFYQTGSFTAMILPKEITLVDTMKLSFKK
jgi:hypothetical protein